MPRKPPRPANQSSQAARSSDNVRAVPHGPIPYSKRVVRRKVHGTVSHQLVKSSRELGL